MINYLTYKNPLVSNRTHLIDCATIRLELIDTNAVYLFICILALNTAAETNRHS